MAAKQEIIKEKLQEYLAASKEGKGRILDAVCQVTGGNRKAAIRRFKILQLRPRSFQERRGRKKVYGHQTYELMRRSFAYCKQRC